MSLYAMHHIVQTDGTVIATCMSHPEWCCVSKNVRESRTRSEESLRDHVAGTIAFAHYEVPVENNAVRASRVLQELPDEQAA